MSQSSSHADHLTSFIDAMKSHGIVTGDPIVADGQLHRIHVDGDPKGKRNGWYIAHIDERPFALFGCKKRFGDEKLKWSGENAAPLTAEERKRLALEAAERKAKAKAEEAARWARAAERANAMWENAAEWAHPYLRRKGVKGHGTRVGDWIKENRDGSTRTIKDALLIPLRHGKDIVSLQAIFAEPITVGDSERDREFLYGGRKEGCWYPIGKPTEVDGVETILIGEGYATCASVHEATGLAVLVAFDAGNLLPVAREIAKRRPKARLVILADNDQFTEVRGVATNPGVEKARNAASAVCGACVVPQFADLAGKPTDFNDLHKREGIDEVCRQVWAIVRPKPQEAAGGPEEPPPWEEAPDYGEPADGPQGAPDEPVSSEPEGKGSRKKPKGGDEAGPAEEPGWFTVLGHDGKHAYIYQSEAKMVYSRALSDLQSSLIALAPLPWWENQYVKAGVTKWKEPAANWITRLAYARGYYDPDSVRGRGAWRDEGRMVLHCGDKLIVDGAEMDLADIKSNYVYEQGARLRPPATMAANRDDGQLIIDIAKMFHWTRPASAILLAGWVALAPLCGALRWRPHIWLTGGTGSGKAQPHSARVLTPTGWATMGELKVGDLVTTPDNGFGVIRGKYPQGAQQVFKLTFADGRSTRATGDHLWKVRVRGEWRIRTTLELLEILNRESQQSKRLAIQLASPLTICGNNKMTLPLAPYALGALLGDGHFGETGTTLTSADPELAEHFQAAISGSEFSLHGTNVPMRYRFGSKSKYGRSARKVIEDLRLLGMRAADKFIPQAYLDASIEDRIELLKGLLDTDGTADEAGSISFCTISKRLRDDVVYLVRSLGGIASVGARNPHFTHNGERRSGQKAYVISIRLPDRSMAFKLSRKRERVEGEYQYADSLYLNLKAIAPDGIEACSCIAIDHPDRLYVTDDFVVTHNTTVLNEFVWPLLNGMEVYAQGNSTEAGIRGKLHRDARPVLFDESEQNNEREVMRVQNVLSLVRQASTESGAQTLKGTQFGGSLGFMIRSMFCLASVQVGIKQQADIERLTILSLRPKRDSVDPAAAWAVLSGGLAKIKADPELPGRLLRRSLDLLPVTVQNIEVFAQAAAEKFGSQREGDQYGAMLAGAWSLVREAPATIEQARAMIDRYDWAEYLEGSETEESTKALGALLSALVRTTKGDVSVYELAARAFGFERTDSDESEFAFTGSKKDADAILRRHGMMTKDIDGIPHLLVANSHIELERLLEKTPYASDIKGQLQRVEGAVKHDPERFGGVSSRSVGIPMRVIMDDASRPAATPIEDDLGFRF